MGRTAQTASATSLTASYDTFEWNLETRADVIAADGIPAETTFVWDPVSDRIIVFFRAGDSKLANDANNNMLKQIIHGDMGYDDPLEVTTIDTSVVVGPGRCDAVARLLQHRQRQVVQGPRHHARDHQRYHRQPRPAAGHYV
ncbi:MAG: hypothetical protein WB973_11590 [Thermoanaerobaculia bacterium]